MLQLPARVAPERFAPIIAPAIETLADQLCQQVRDRQNPFEWIDIWVPEDVPDSQRRFKCVLREN